MNKYELKARYNITPEQLRKQFYDIQNRRCYICSDELEFGHATCYDRGSGKVLCRKCVRLVSAIRPAVGKTLDQAIALVMGSDSDGGEDYKDNGD